MTDSPPVPKGPLFGLEDSVLIEVIDENNQKYSLQIFPDAANAELREAGRPTRYYYLPRVSLVKKQASQDFDFTMRIFNGSVTSETDIGITPLNEDTSKVLGGICSFSVTFAVPPEVITDAIQQLKAIETGTDGKEPHLQMVTTNEDITTIEIPRLGNRPLLIDVKRIPEFGGTATKDVISYSFSFNQDVAREIADRLRKGISPFIVRYSLRQRWNINECLVRLSVDLKQAFTVFMFSLAETGGILNSVSLSAGFQRCIGMGAIRTDIVIGNAPMDHRSKNMIDTCSEELIKRSFKLLKDKIFDLTPTLQPSQPESSGFSLDLFKGLFEGFTLSMKSKNQITESTIEDTFTLDGQTMLRLVETSTLADLEDAIKSNLDKYLFIKS